MYPPNFPNDTDEQTFISKLTITQMLQITSDTQLPAEINNHIIKTATYPTVEH